MPRYSSFLIAIVLLAAGLTPVTTRAWPKQLGKITGQVVDINDARIVRARVVIVGQNLDLRLLTNVEGEFETSLPPGEYWLSISADGFRSFEAQKFQIKSGKTKHFNVEMQVKQPQETVPAASPSGS